MKEINKKLIDAIKQKAELICPDALDLLAIYGSAATGDEHEKSDLDLLILINGDAGWQLADCFILDDVKIGYDIYCTTWEGLEQDAECDHAKLAKLMDSKVIFCRDENVQQRLDAAKEKAGLILGSDLRFEKAEKLLQTAKQEYADSCFTDDLAEVRVYAGDAILNLLDALMLYHGRYFHRGTKRTFEEMSELALPFDLQGMVLSVIKGDTAEEIRRELKKLFRAITQYMKQSGEKEKSSPDNLRGSYEEMFSNWKNKMPEAAERKDIFSSFMNLLSLQLMLQDIDGDVDVEKLRFMHLFDPGDPARNVQVFDNVLAEYHKEYEKLGMTERRFENVDAFVEKYLESVH
ncbi:MAG: nucleotidyltransferase domain-containing protein [Eubacterium sp.]|nr:nucleotidyltransferase domain-containing protein [Eubacterium sp.]